MEQQNNRPTLPTGEFYEFADRSSPLAAEENERQQTIFRNFLKKIGCGDERQGESVMQRKCRRVLVYRTMPSANEIARNTARKIFSYVFCPPAEKEYNYDAFMLYCRNSGQLSEDITGIYSVPPKPLPVTELLPPPLQLPDVSLGTTCDTIPHDFPVLDLSGLSLPPAPPPVQPMPVYTPANTQVPPNSRPPAVQIYPGLPMRRKGPAQNIAIQKSTRSPPNIRKRSLPPQAPIRMADKRQEHPEQISLSTRTKLSLFGGAVLLNIIAIGSALQRTPQTPVTRQCWQKYEHGRLGVGCEDQSGAPLPFDAYAVDLGPAVIDRLKQSGTATAVVTIRDGSGLKCALLLSKKKLTAGMRDRDQGWQWPREDILCMPDK